MKRRIILSLPILIVLFLCGCENGSSSHTPSNNSVKDVPENEVSKEENTESEEARQSGLNENAPEPVKEEAPVLSSTEGIDIDLTSLSSTMVYSQVYNMISEPSSFIGKMVRMNGLFSYFYDETNDRHYFACIIKDATACCAQGIEFVLDGDYVFPEDYPEPGSEITVTGVFDTYEEGEYMYCTLRKASMSF